MLDTRTPIVALLVALGGACTNDYGTFEGTPAAADANAGAAGTGTGGSPADAGQDTSVGGSGGGDQEAGFDGPGPDTGCAQDQKRCGKACVGLDDPQTGCAAESCDPCNLAHATAACSGGACVVASCDSGFGDCNGNAGDGCETGLTKDKDNCGQCDQACAGSLSCVQSQCVCTKPPDCMAGSAGACEQGVCVCGGNECDPGERCDAQGECQ